MISSVLLQAASQPLTATDWVFIICFFGVAPILLILFSAYFYFVGYLISIRDVRWLKLFSYFSAPDPAMLMWLEKNSTFYTAISPRYQKRMARRMKFLLMELDIQGSDVKVSEEVRWMLVATYAQMTIGLSTPWLKRNKTILFYESVPPEDAEVRLHLTSFCLGFQNGEDGMNEGIRFLFDAMKDENRYRSKKRLRYIFESRAYNAWKGAVNEEIQRVSTLGFRYNTGVEISQEEFMALSLVYFFEMPEKFMQRHQKLYAATRRLMNWDPIQKRKLK